MSKVRLNDLARELEVKSKVILDALPIVGVTEKKTHSSSLEEHEAEKVRAYLRPSAQAQTSAARSARPLRGEEEIKTKLDLSHISRPGDVLKAITNQKAASLRAPSAPTTLRQSRGPIALRLASPDTPIAPPQGYVPRMIVPQTGPRPVYKVSPRSTTSPATKLTAPAAKSTVLSPALERSTTPGIPPSSEPNPPVPAVSTDLKSGIAVPGHEVPTRRPILGVPPKADTSAFVLDSLVTQCNRRHIVDIDLKESDPGPEYLELEFKYQCHDEGMTASHPLRIRGHKVGLAKSKELADNLSHELQGLNGLAGNRPPLANIEKIAGELFEQLIPDDLSERLRKESACAYLVLNLPAELTWMPWELLWDPEKKHFLCQAFKISRYLQKTGADFRKAEMRRLEARSGRSLILTGNTSSPQLEAEAEKAEVERYFDQLFYNLAWCYIAEGSHCGLELLESDFDICHFIGHGKFVAEDPRQSGWVMRDSSVLTCKEIEGNASKTLKFPLLIFANSCDSAHPGVADSGAYVHLLYHAFLRLGVPHYIGTINKVQDRFEDRNKEMHYPAAEFARDFYRSLACGCSVGEALCIARRGAFGKPGAPIWASYVHYGDPAFQFVAKPAVPRRSLKSRLARARLPVPATYRGIFVDRFQELSCMRGSLQMLAEGKSSILLLTGDVGSGKSALLKRFLSEAMHSLEPVGIATAECQKRIRHNAHAVLREIFGHLLQCPNKLFQPQQEALTVGEFVLSELLFFPQLVSLCRPDVILGADGFRRISERLGFDPKRATVAQVPADELTIVDELEQALQRISEVVPLVLAIENLQWADETALTWFHQLCTLSSSRLLLIGTCRSHGIQGSSSNSALEDILNEARRYGARTVSLDLTTGNTDKGSNNHRRLVSFIIRYLRQALPIVSAKQRPGTTLVDTLVEYTGGNALFLAEMVEWLRKTNAIEVGPNGDYDSWDLSERRPCCIGLPESVRGVIEGRLNELNRDILKTLKIASVLGRDFSLEALVHLSSLDEGTVRSHLEDLVHVHRLIDELEDDTRARGNPPVTMLRFRSRAIQEFIHDRLSSAEQRHLHEKAGEYLEENLRGDDRYEWLVQLATHFFIAEEWPKNFDYALEAARCKALDPYRRVLHLENALSLLEPATRSEDVDEREASECYARWCLEEELDYVKECAECEDEFDYYFQQLLSLKDAQELRRELQFYQENSDQLDDAARKIAIIHRALGYPPTSNQTSRVRK